MLSDRFVKEIYDEVFGWTARSNLAHGSPGPGTHPAPRRWTGRLRPGWRSRSPDQQENGFTTCFMMAPHPLVGGSAWLPAATGSLAKVGSMLELGAPGELDSAAACSPWSIAKMMYGTCSISVCTTVTRAAGFPFSDLQSEKRKLSGPWSSRKDSSLSKLNLVLITQ